MAEQKIKAAAILLQEPCRQVMLQDYRKTLEDHKFRKKIEGIENEISWFNGKSNQYKIEDRQGFFRHFQDHYAGKRSAAMGPVYRPLTSFTFGQEPEIVYFMMLYVKKDQELADFRKEYPDASAIQRNDVLRIRYQKLRNEYRLLAALLERLDQPVGAIVVTIAECFVTDFTSNIEKLNPPILRSRFARSLRRKDTDQPFVLAAALREQGAEDADFLDIIANHNAGNYDKVVELAEAFDKEDKNYPQVIVMETESCAKLGKINEFIAGFKSVKEDTVDMMHFMYMLQELITHAPYSELDTDEFDASIQELLKSKFKQVENSSFSGPVSRNFINCLDEGLPLAAGLLKISEQGGEGKLPEDKLNRLYQLQMALDLYPNEDISSLIDLDELSSKGLKASQEKIGRLAISLLLEKSKEKPFENIYLAFRTLKQMGLEVPFVHNIESNLELLKRFGRGGQTGAYELIKDAYEIKKNSLADTALLEDALNEAGIDL